VNEAVGIIFRLRTLWQSTRTKVLRWLAGTLVEAGNWTLARAKTKSRKPSKRDKRRGQTRVPWSTLIRQVGHPKALRMLLDGGVIGADLPRRRVQPSGGRILVLAGHQDDETIGAGGTFLLLAASGANFNVAYYTDGATAFGNFTSEETTRVRYDEAQRIWKRIASCKPLFWGYPNRSDEVAIDAADRLVALIAEFRPTAIFLPNFFEQPVEHKRLNEVLCRANAIQSISESVEIWGYQITTRVPGNSVVDITSTWKKKYQINKMWRSQNTYLDYSHLAMGQDIANSYYLKGARTRVRAHAEVFLTFNAPEYIELARTFLDLPEDSALLKRTRPHICPPPNFFIIGMQKSGSYWLTALLDAHPSIRCFPSRPGHADGTGEAHLFDILARFDTDYQGLHKSFQRKLEGQLASIVPKNQPNTKEERQRMFDDIRIHFNAYCHQQRLRYGKPVVGEKTTETVHHLGLVETMYPGVSKICIVRDPRDRTVSFFFHQIRKGRIRAPAVFNSHIPEQHVTEYIERVRKDYEGLLDVSEPVFVVMYEKLLTSPMEETEKLLRFLGVPSDQETIRRIVDAASFERLSSRVQGEEDVTSHFRKGVTGDWQERISESESKRIVQELEDLTHRLEERFQIDLSLYREIST